MSNILKFFKDKSTGFYLGMIAAILSLSVGIVYQIGYGGGTFYDVKVVIISILASVLFFALTFNKYTIAWASVCLCLLDFIAFLLFIQATYLYLPDVFFGGVSLDAILSLDTAYKWSVGLFLLSIILSNVGAWLSKDKKTKEKEACTNE